jgi:hypothetical protein
MNENKTNVTENTENTEVREPRKLKTLANCTSGECIKQIYKIITIIKDYADGIKRLKEVTKAEGEGQGDAFSIISYICGDNFDKTMEVCGAMCFMSGEEFANLDPADGADGIVEIAKVLSSERVTGFFISVLRMKGFCDKL